MWVRGPLGPSAHNERSGGSRLLEQAEGLPGLARTRRAVVRTSVLGGTEPHRQVLLALALPVLHRLLLSFVDGFLRAVVLLFLLFLLCLR